MASLPKCVTQLECWGAACALLWLVSLWNQTPVLEVRLLCWVGSVSLAQTGVLAHVPLSFRSFKKRSEHLWVSCRLGCCGWELWHCVCGAENCLGWCIWQLCSSSLLICLWLSWGFACQPSLWVCVCTCLSSFNYLSGFLITSCVFVIAFLLPVLVRWIAACCSFCWCAVVLSGTCVLGCLSIYFLSVRSPTDSCIIRSLYLSLRNQFIYLLLIF